MKTKDQTLKTGVIFDKINVCFNNVKINMWEYTFFICRNKKDKIIDISMQIIVKFLLLQNEILKLSRRIQNGKVNIATYENCFDIITDEMVNDYDVQLSQCESLISEIMKSLIKDRKLNSILDEKAN